jgi:hypothetical protein
MLPRRILIAGSGEQIHLIAGIQIVGVDERAAVQRQHGLWILVMVLGDAPDRIALLGRDRVRLERRSRRADRSVWRTPPPTSSQRGKLLGSIASNYL